MNKPSAVYLLPRSSYDLIYSGEPAARIDRLTHVLGPVLEPGEVLKYAHLLRQVELIFTGWGSLAFDESTLQMLPQLKMVFYGAGSVRGTVTDAFWQQGLRICSAWAANAVPVVEYTMAQIFLCLKKAHQHAALYRANHHMERLSVAGGYGSTVGLISLGMIGRMVLERLRTFDVKVIAYDPFVSAEKGAQMGVEMVSLEDVFRRSDVISLHTPWLESTVGMIRGEHFALMKPGASFINTARGAVVREAEMIEALQRRPDLFAVLDVTWPEPPVPASPLYSLTNVFLTPHIAGSMDGECRRMGHLMADELERYLAGEAMRYELTRERAEIMA